MWDGGVQDEDDEEPGTAYLGGPVQVSTDPAALISAFPHQQDL